MMDRQLRAGGADPGAPAAAPAAANLLDSLLAPTSREAFFAKYFEQAPLACGGGEAGRYRTLLTLQAVDALIDSADLRHDMLKLVAGGDPVDPERYVGPSGRILPTAVAEAYQRGATIILPQLHLSVEPIADFCRALEGEFSAAVQANAYLTPASSRGFDAHYDQHDVFILQIEGSKTWRLYGTPAEAAVGAPFTRGAHEPGPVSAEFVLAPGGCLYVPRGLMHEAANRGEEPSLHLTFGIFPKRWADLAMAAVAALVQADPAFQRALPPGFATQAAAREAAEEAFPSVLGKLGSAGLGEAIELFAQDFLHERRPSIAGIIASPRPKGPLRRRPLLLFRVRNEGTDVVLDGPGGDLRFARSDEAALAIALSGYPFDPASLPTPDPRRLVDRLWANGYLELASDGRSTDGEA